MQGSGQTRQGTGSDLCVHSISLVFYNRFGQRLTFALLSDILFVHPIIISLLYYRCSSGFIQRSESFHEIGRTKNHISFASIAKIEIIAVTFGPKQILVENFSVRHNFSKFKAYLFYLTCFATLFPRHRNWRCFWGKNKKEYS